MNVLALKIFMVIVASMRQVGKSKGPVVLEMKYDSPFYPCSENLHYKGRLRAPDIFSVAVPNVTLPPISI